MAAFYVGSGLNHFLLPELHVAVVPPALPWRLPLVLVSGAAAMLLGALLLVPACRRLAAWGIVVLLLLLLPVHVHMVLHPEVLPWVPPWALWLRLPLQLVLVAWALWHARYDSPARVLHRSAGKLRSL